MPMFDYKGADGRELVALAYDLAIEYSQGEPEGWRRLTPQELGLDPSVQDANGFYRGTSLPGAQAHVLGQFDVNGTLTRLAVAFTATNDGQDPADYGAMADDSYANDFDYLLDAVRFYAAPQGLTGENVIVTGYSLGAGAANTMAAQRDVSWGGFYAGSDYIGVAVPKLTEIADVLNFGFENDVVHRVTGEGDADARSGDPTLGVLHNDGLYGTATDNVVLFNDVYATGGFEAVPMTLANIPRDWAAHVDIPDENWVRRIGGSNFYEHIEMDSPVVMAHLSDVQRGLIWVEDKQTVSSDHFGQSGFVLGSELADRLGDGAADDMLDGFAGDDLARLGTGDDRIHGGAGLDTVQLASAAGGYDRVRLSDGTVYLRDLAGGNGLEALVSVERVTTRDPLDTVVYAVGGGGLTAANQPTLAWSAHREGGEGVDALAARASGERLFGRGGADSLTGGAGLDWLHGGDGKDALRGGGGADILTGWDGDDLLKGGGGADQLDGGQGYDAADFRDMAGRVVLSLNGRTAATATVGGAAADAVKNVEAVYGGSGGDVLTGDSAANLLMGNDGDDFLKGGLGRDALHGGAGRDVADFRDETSALTLRLNGVGEATTSVGGVAGDRVSSIEAVLSGAGADLLIGDAFANTLSGGGGADILRGLAGADVLNGGAGRDLFFFNAPAESTTAVGGRDTIADFSRGDGDLIALNVMDANVLQAGDQAFTLGALGTAGRLQVTAAGSGAWLVQGDVDGGGADFAIVVRSDVALIGSDFVL